MHCTHLPYYTRNNTSCLKRVPYHVVLSNLRIPCATTSTSHILNFIISDVVISNGVSLVCEKQDSKELKIPIMAEKS
jgi:hypothetical protein